ncbi:MAG: hypothetical protein GX031_03280 [Candidatus Riflebacteria bacterium]|nr:hypothetical protein [Candidatus Riflebacteria bacterium]
MSEIKIQGYYGTWYVIDVLETDNGDLFLLESEQYGDEVPGIIVNNWNEVMLDYVYNGFEDWYDSYSPGWGP